MSEERWKAPDCAVPREHCRRKALSSRCLKGHLSWTTPLFHDIQTCYFLTCHPSASATLFYLENVLLPSFYNYKSKSAEKKEYTLSYIYKTRFCAEAQQLMHNLFTCEGKLLNAIKLECNLKFFLNFIFRVHRISVITRKQFILFCFMIVIYVFPVSLKCTIYFIIELIHPVYSRTPKCLFENVLREIYFIFLVFQVSVVTKNEV